MISHVLHWHRGVASGITGAACWSFTNVYCTDTKNVFVHVNEYLQQDLSYDQSYSFYTYSPPSPPCSAPRKTDPLDCTLHFLLPSGFWLHSSWRRPWQIREKRRNRCKAFLPCSGALSGRSPIPPPLPLLQGSGSFKLLPCLSLQP